MSRLTRKWLLIGAAFCLSTPVFAMDDGAGDYAEARGMAGAGIALVSDASSIELNPAGLSLGQRYALGMLYSQSSTAGAFGFSVADNKTSPFAMGLDYRRQWAKKDSALRNTWVKRDELTLAVSEAYEGKFLIGFSYNYKNDRVFPLQPATAPTAAPLPATEISKLARHNLTTGVIVPFGDMVQVGLVLYDLAWFARKAQDPKVAVGLGVAPHEAFRFAFDLISVTNDQRHWRATAGVQLIARGHLALRGGWHEDFYDNWRRFAASASWMFGKGQIGYSFNTEPDKFHRHGISFELSVL